MATIPDLISRARLEINDVSARFQDIYQGDGVTGVLTTSRKPVDATTVVVSRSNGTTTTTLSAGVDYTLDVHSGEIALTTPLAVGSTLTVTGSAFRYFGDDDWTAFVTDAMDQHLHNRVDELGRPLGLDTLPGVEEYPLMLLIVIQALYALVSDASFDIDISAPEGVAVPRHQRVQQLWDLLAQRLAQYNELCGLLNIGLRRVEMFELRRKSYLTGRLIPIYQQQEWQDTRFPRQIFPEINTDGAAPEPTLSYQQVINLVGYSNQDFAYTLTLGQDITGMQVAAQIRRYPQALTPMIYMTATVVDPAIGKITVGVNARLMYYAGVSKYWDLQTIDAQGNIQTVVGGTFDSVRQGNP